ncbi:MULTISPECIES: ricin-type beta-trefoil lectin domain protein [Micromonospora]|uniref:Ricin-type beta-trefoil lectin domain-containing protein n=1 Tax=Micromonospora yangpuensis TaxID=683228 RepID=A0A1C6V335_9ACTN|nr:ricin-type beta-trefoil lectin domain protein [Micromonospora yangpuensis]GGM14800.1 hypothetical protein GCM10012279_36210 [Micromonospora yangpuensis]SCL60761.1 Ricin-type beta-trefoil lectin domain-containing protein [Micromonospora yangpuensis]
MPRRAAAGAVGGLAVVSMVVAAIGWGVASAQDDDLTGRTVSDEHLTTIQAAARACPALSPARLAGQLMAESGLDPMANETASGGKGIAGLDSDKWKRWAPWPNAERSDSAANIFALAHQMCDLSGQVRVSEIAGDGWRLSLAAFHTGIDKVRDAKGVPSDALGYVDQASGYAGYYGKLVAFGGSGEPRPRTDRQQPKAVPAEYTKLIVKAGSVCELVPPAAVAAQLMALSEFDVNMLGPNGERGIAQFRPEVWQEHGPKDVSAWDPRVAIPAVGTAMCALQKELAGLEGDPYLVALAAYRNGPTAVRQTGGNLDAETQSFARTVREHTEFYTLDGRLKLPASANPEPSPTPKPKPAPTETESESPTPAPTPDPVKNEETEEAPKPETPADDETTAAAPKPNAPEAEPPARPSNMRQIQLRDGWLCLSAGTGGDGTPVTMQKCREDKSQWWDFRSDGTVRANSLCLDVAWAEKKDGTAVQVAKCNGTGAQKWERITHGGKRVLFNRYSDRCLDRVTNKVGSSMNIWICVGNAEQEIYTR